MWDKWKEKIQRFIWKEVEVEVEVEVDREEATHDAEKEHLPDIQAKIAYQYPENKSFPFPVIPDQKKTNNPSDIPAFQRRNSHNESFNRKPTNNQQHETYKRDLEKKPFKPSEVPSPIYGFHPRNKKTKEIESVPAYVRKQQKQSDSPLFTEKRHQSIPIHNMQEQDMLEQAAVTNEVETLANKVHTNESDILEKRNEQSSDVKNEAPVLQRTKKHREVHRVKDPRERIVPYNVMMTQQDKSKVLLQQDKQPKAQEQKQSSTNGQTDQRVIPFHLLSDPEPKHNGNRQWIREQQSLLEKTLKHFNVRARVVHATQGPAVTRFEVQPELGVKVSKVKNLSDDLKLNMSAKDIRIEAPIPGKNTIGIEVPNPQASMVSLQEIFETEAFQKSSSPLSIALGLNIEGTPVITNIEKMPHGLIAGATGSGKSVCINAILISLLYKANHEDVKFILIDPKMVELAPYNGIPHLISPVINDVKAATAALKWAVNEMEERYEKFVQESVRDIKRYNQKMLQQNRLDEKMSYIVIVIDELADLMMVSPQDVEDAICRIAQKARACGIHLLLATQRPSVDVITGLIKANIPTRIAFSVSSQVDSKTIIDKSGAEKLLGKGDMLFVENGAGKSVRLQGPFVSDEEIERVTNYVRSLAPPNYLFEQETLLNEFIADESEDELLHDAIQFVVSQGSASTSLLQRHFKIGYNRAARLIDNMENRGIISGQNGSKPRDVFITSAQLNEMEDSLST